MHKDITDKINIQSVAQSSLSAEVQKSNAVPIFKPMQNFQIRRIFCE